MARRRTPLDEMNDLLREKGYDVDTNYPGTPPKGTGHAFMNTDKREFWITLDEGEQVYFENAQKASEHVRGMPRRLG